MIIDTNILMYLRKKFSYFKQIIFPNYGILVIIYKIRVIVAAFYGKLNYL